MICLYVLLFAVRTKEAYDNRNFRSLDDPGQKTDMSLENMGGARAVFNKMEYWVSIIIIVRFGD